jgi:hypothetical protein
MKNEKKNMAIIKLVENFGRCRVVSTYFDNEYNEKLSMQMWKRAMACKHGIKTLINQGVSL